MARTPHLRSTLLAALAATALLAACAKGGDQEEPAATDAAGPAANAAGAAPNPTPSGPSTPSSTVTDPQIASIVVTANAVDSTSGELALQKGTHARVKEFAQRMVTDHGGVNQQAVALATRLGVTPEDNPISRQLAQGGQQTRQQLEGMSGEQFDRAYMDSEVEYHETVLAAIDQTLIPSAQNAELRALLEQTRPAVQAHLEMARQIQGELAGGR